MTCHHTVLNDVLKLLLPAINISLGWEKRYFACQQLRFWNFVKKRQKKILGNTVIYV